MGAGIARQIAKAFPEAQAADNETVAGDLNKLGSISFHNYGNLIVVNAYTQFSFGEGPQISYYAIISACRVIKSLFSGKKIGFPKIGAGLGGGDWRAIEWILEKSFEGEDVTIVEYQE